MLENCLPFPKPLLIEIISQNGKKEKKSTYLVISQMFKHKA